MKTFGVIEQVTHIEEVTTKATRNGHLKEGESNIHYEHTHYYKIKFDVVYSKDFMEMFQKTVAEYGGRYDFIEEEGILSPESQLPDKSSAGCWCGFMKRFMDYAGFEIKHIGGKTEHWELDIWEGENRPTFIEYQQSLDKDVDKQLIFET